MTQSKAKRMVVALTVGAVLLLAILLFVMIYQLISIKVKNDKLDELDSELALYEQLIEDGKDTLEARSKRIWIEQRAYELGLVYEGDDVLN